MAVPNEEWAIYTWKERVYDRSEEVDPGNEQDWYSLALGFAFGLGYTPEQAHKLAGTISSKGLL